MPKPLDDLPNILGCTRAEIERVAGTRGVPAFRGRQVFTWIWRQGVTDVEKMTNLGADARAAFTSAFSFEAPHVVSRRTSEDGTTKLLLELGDRRHIEAVYIPDTPAQTFCISTQVGCAMACDFCLTGTMGFVRHLTAAEIAAQVLVLARDTDLLRAPFNIVLMGMGEPLHNFDATMQALEILADDEGLAVHPRRVTLSTVGILPALERLATSPVMPNLAISLHGTTDEQRSAIVPVNRKYPLADLLAACRRFPLPRRRRITFEYVLLAGVNDSLEDAERLARLLDGIQAKVNLLPLNEAPGIDYRRPDDERVNAFARVLAERGLTVMVRKSRGRDIRAACGQLATETGREKSAAQQLADALDR